MTDDLKPCPFCGGKDVDGKMHKDGRVHCYRCGADGPAVPYAHDDKAFTWNNRTLPLPKTQDVIAWDRLGSGGGND